MSLDLPQRIEVGLYTPGRGHTGGAWPRGAGHDYCWDPHNCISCGCSRNGPGLCHIGIALNSGWRPIEGEGTVRELLDRKAAWDVDMRRIAAKVDAEHRAYEDAIRHRK